MLVWRLGRFGRVLDACIVGLGFARVLVAAMCWSGLARVRCQMRAVNIGPHALCAGSALCVPRQAQGRKFWSPRRLRAAANASAVCQARGARKPLIGGCKKKWLAYFLVCYRPLASAIFAGARRRFTLQRALLRPIGKQKYCSYIAFARQRRFVRKTSD